MTADTSAEPPERSAEPPERNEAAIARDAGNAGGKQSAEPPERNEAAIARDARAWRRLPTAHSAPTELREALDSLASTLGLTSIDSVKALFVDWPDIVGAELADHCKPRRLTDGVLTIEASDRQWATELKWMTTLLAERCCEALGDGAVVRVRIIG